MGNKVRKTYGVRGKVECVLLIKCGKATMEVHFQGGAISGYGTTPAKYSTADPVKQHIIEHSEQYRNGGIVLIREVAVTGDHAAQLPGTGKKAANGTALVESQMPGQATTVAMIMDSALNPSGNAAEEQHDTGAEIASGEQHDTGSDGYKEVAVTDTDDAREYLVKLGASRTSVRTIPGVLREAEARKIRFVGME